MPWSLTGIQSKIYKGNIQVVKSDEKVPEKARFCLCGKK
jgi:hypothetical protein